MNPIFIKAKELFEIEQHYLKIINLKTELDFEESISLIFKALKIVEDLNFCIVEQDPSNLETVEDNIRNTLKMVRNGKGLKCIDAYETLKEYLKPNMGALNNQGADERNFVENNWDSLFDIFHSCFDINSYFQNKLKIGPLITSSSVPNELKSNFVELKEAYAYGLGNACVALCRMLIEIGYADVLSKFSDYKDALKINRVAKDKAKFEFSLFENINIASSLNLISQELAEKSHKIRMAGNDIIHTNKSVNHKESDPADIIESTVQVLETIYNYEELNRQQQH